MPRYIQTEDKAFIRDMHSKALLSTDRVALERSRQQRRQAHTQQQEIASLHSICDNLQKRMDYLTELVETVVTQVTKINAVVD